jgi:hypothetical protein
MFLSGFAVLKRQNFSYWFAQQVGTPLNDGIRRAPGSN